MINCWFILLLVLCGLLHLPSIQFLSVPSLKTNIYMSLILYNSTYEDKDIFGTDSTSLYHINIQTFFFLEDHTFIVLSGLIFDA